MSLGDGTWVGFAPGMGEGIPYLFWISGTSSSGPKRDPYARELAETSLTAPASSATLGDIHGTIRVGGGQHSGI